ncbi:MAG: CsbD family protein [Pseudorhodobacter sp. PARRP1]|nr:MAG: CsbD family protein [Pseudorhodobacter sp. PARRP1]
MDKDRIAGSAKVIKGKAKEAIGSVLGDAKMETEGKADQVEGRVQNAVGSAKDKVREVVKGK